MVSTKDSSKSRARTGGYRYCIAIDFGSTYSGFAWASMDDPSAVMCNEEWDSQPPGMTFCKTPTSIRYRRQADGSYMPHNWGHKRKKTEPALLRSGEIIEIARFKLWFDESVPRDGLPADMHWMQPSIDYLSFISNFARDVVRQENDGGVLNDSEILWCITVPAIWDERGKNNVRQAATYAGIITEATKQSLRIILEPEAAALYALKSMPELSGNNNAMFMILDAGGGTVDLTTHSISTNVGAGIEPRLIEQSRGTGGLCGSTFVDRKFVGYMSEIVGAATLKRIQAERPDLLVQVLQQWEQVKRNFRVTKRRGQVEMVDEAIQLPSAFVAMVPKSVRQQWARDSDSGQDDELPIPFETMLQLFEEPVRQCLDLINEQLGRIGGQCEHLVLVGGFSSSPYLCHRVKQEFNSKFNKILTLANPSGAIVYGAVVYGLGPSQIQQRRCRFSYGYISKVRKPNSDVSSNDIRVGDDGQEYLQVFKCLVGENQLVGADEEFFSDVAPISSTKSEVSIDLVATPVRLEAGQAYSYSEVKGIVSLCTFRVFVPPKAAERTIRIAYRFGETEFNASATVAATGEVLETSLFEPSM
ncbi:hypothetical protein BC831DRAFT_486906 [Entophlyctis helioformis]|nr:hypothetical protein BC831DRAFT_486906 [Entophlyctis helioformis]